MKSVRPRKLTAGRVLVGVTVGAMVLAKISHDREVRTGAAGQQALTTLNADLAVLLANLDDAGPALAATSVRELARLYRRTAVQVDGQTARGLLAMAAVLEDFADRSDEFITAVDDPAPGLLPTRGLAASGELDRRMAKTQRVVDATRSFASAWRALVPSLRESLTRSGMSAEEVQVIVRSFESGRGVVEFAGLDDAAKLLAAELSVLKFLDVRRAEWTADDAMRPVFAEATRQKEFDALLEEVLTRMRDAAGDAGTAAD